MFGINLRRILMVSAVISISLIIFQCGQSFGAKQKWKYMSNSGCKCHMSKGCFEGEEYKKMKYQQDSTFERQETDEDKTKPE